MHLHQTHRQKGLLSYLTKNRLILFIATALFAVTSFYIHSLALFDILIADAEHAPPKIQQQQIYNFSLGREYQNPFILKEKCSITVVLMDPDVSEAAMWMLESVAEYVQPTETTCVLIQTSICAYLQKKEQVSSPETINENSNYAYQQKANHITTHAKPMFRFMIQQGQVRMTVLNHTKYHLKSCSNFYSPNFAFENIHYWGTEEYTSQDSDLVLVVQDDAVLCQTLAIDQWKDVAWVGAPWKPTYGKKAWNFCSSLPNLWNESHHRARKSNSATQPPPYPHNASEICSVALAGPHGNGGFSLRQRSWLRKVIHYCPAVPNKDSLLYKKKLHVHGLTQEEFDEAVCQAAPHAEDIYFVSFLRGLEAPIPSILDAALFSWEGISIPKIIQTFHITNQTWIQERVTKRWYSNPLLQDDDAKEEGDAWARFLKRRGQRNRHPVMVPIGIHKPWGLIRRYMCDWRVHEQCKYLKPMLTSNKWGEMALEKDGIRMEDCGKMPVST